MIRVLIVDDSALMRQMLSATLSEDPEIEVVGVASDPIVARKQIKLKNPDVITLDVEMPRLDGLAFLEHLMRLRPTPVVMISALTQKGADVTLQALEAGAVDFVAKPTIDIKESWDDLKGEVVAKVKAASRANPQTRVNHKPQIIQADVSPIRFKGSRCIIVIGASAGGVMALSEVLSALPADSPPILIAQHMPPRFTEQFATRLNGHCALSVAEATCGSQLLSGHAYLAPGDRHLQIVKSGGHYNCKLDDGPLYGGHRPSVDVLFRSARETAGANAIGVLLTGMGKDGAQGLLEMRQAGSHTIGQDETSCLVYGMPKAAKLLGAVERELPLTKIAVAIMDRVSIEAVP